LQFAENDHAVGQSSLESFLRLTNRTTNGEQVTVFGYGACLEAVATGAVDAASCVVPVPGPIDRSVATSYLDRKYPPAPR
jgi:S-adenosylhomocysteine hydrolase